MNDDESDRATHLPSQAPEWTSIDDARTLLLRFRDRTLVASYLQAEFERNHRQIVVTSLVILVFLTGFYWIDPLIAPRQALAAIQLARVWVNIPGGIGLLTGAIVIRRIQAWRWLSGTIFTAFLCCHCMTLSVVGTASFAYMSAGFFEGLVGLFFASNLPLRQSLVIGAACEMVFLGVALAGGVDILTLIDVWGADAIIVFAFCTLAVYRYEKASRAQFVSQERFRRAYEHRLAAEADRRRWLEVFADFLGHELKNSLIGVASSLELASRLRAEPVVDRYFERARRSLDNMRRLLRQVTMATNIESALERKASVVFDLAELVKDRVEDFAEAHPARSFELRLDGAPRIEGDPDSMLQVLDKLFGNAIEHGDPAHPIVVALDAGSGSCRLTVSDVGDPLPEDREAIFKPFVTQKNPATREGNLGLGLFVARTIVGHHHGALHAEPLAGAIGARFVIDLPLSAAVPHTGVAYRAPVADGPATMMNSPVQPRRAWPTR